MLVGFEAVSFARSGQDPVLKDVNLTLAAGEVCALVGRSGAGKTTLLKLVNRLLLPTSGSVLVEGIDTRRWDGIRLRRRVGYVFQDVGLFPHMTVEENVSIVPRLEGWDAARMRARAHELLDLMGLPPALYAARRPHELSGGQRQRVGLARALAAHPPLLLMDEPFGALDPLTRLDVREAFGAARARLGTTVLIVTHDVSEALALDGRIGVLEAGRLLLFADRREAAASSDPSVRAFMATVPGGPPS